MTTDAQLLSALRSSGGAAIPIADLLRQLGISRPLLDGRIKELRSLGYAIEVSPHTGCRLVATPDSLHADDLLSRLPATRVIGRDIRVFEETTSTSDIIEKLARDGVKEGMVVFAESQTRGRGRRGRRWISPSRKGLWFSVLLRPNLFPVEATRLTVAAATALARAIQAQTGLSPDVKWPNDLLLRGRKVAGILTEMSAEADRVHHVIVGIGLDVNQEKSDFPGELQATATSLRIESGQPVHRAELAAAIMQELDHDYARLSCGEFPVIADEWEGRCTTLGHNVSVRIGDRTIQGRAESLDDAGALLVRTEHGRIERVLGGDVTVER